MNLSGTAATTTLHAVDSDNDNDEDDVDDDTFGPT